MKKVITVIVAVFVFSCSSAQVEIEWQKTIGGNNYDFLKDIQQTLDGGYILCGQSNSDISGDKTENNIGPGPDDDCWIVKIDSMGNLMWQNTIGGNSFDASCSILHTSDGGYVLAGGSSSNISGDKTENSCGGEDIWIIKISSIGNIEWQNSIGGSNGDGAVGAESLQQTADGGYIIGSTSASSISCDKTENNWDSMQNTFDYWVVKLDSVGTVEWENTIGGNGEEWLYSIEQTYDGGYILGGDSKSNISGDKTENSYGDDDIWIVKIDSVGNIQWQNDVGGSGIDYFGSMAQTSDSGYILGALSYSNISGDKTENCKGGRDFWIIKTNPQGVIQWQKTIGGSGEDILQTIQQTSDGGYIAGGHSASIPSGDKTDQNNGGSDYWIVKTDSIGNIEWQKTIGGNDYDDFKALQSINNGFILGGFSSSNVSADKSENCRGAIDYWVVKLTDKFNSITGKTFLDFNNNQIKDSSDIYLEGQLITESNTNRIAFSDQNGNYSLSILDSGNFFVFPSSINNYMAVPISHSGNFNGIKQTDSLNDFAFQPIPGINDLQISITPLTAFRPGFNASYLLNYKNVGTTTLNASIVFYLEDTNYSYVTANVTPSQITLDSVLWNNISLTPWEQGSITVTVHINAGVPIGTLLSSSCIINPIASDNFQRDNYASWDVLATGSYDPNDKLVSDTTFTTTQLSDSSFLDYIIRFQNTGNDTAFNVRVLDNISTDLDLTTFQLVSSSHPFNINYKAHSRLMTFTFDNILLPDSGTNELLSHGFIRYRIRPVSTLAVGDKIKNTAFIYFDFNDPVQTNWAETEIVMPNAIESLTFETSGLKLFPSPVSDVLHIQRTPAPPKAGAAAQVASLKIYDVTGRIVYKTNFSFQKSDLQLDVNKLTIGVYVVEVTDGEQALRGKFLKE